MNLDQLEFVLSLHFHRKMAIWDREVKQETLKTENVCLLDQRQNSVEKQQQREVKVVQKKERSPTPISMWERGHFSFAPLAKKPKNKTKQKTCSKTYRKSERNKRSSVELPPPRSQSLILCAAYLWSLVGGALQNWGVFLSVFLRVYVFANVYAHVFVHVTTLCVFSWRL